MTDENSTSKTTDSPQPPSWENPAVGNYAWVDYLCFVIVVGMFIAAAVMWDRVPEEMPVHWNLQGEPDRWGGRFEGLLLMPIIALGIYGLLRVIPAAIPDKENFAQFAGVYSMIQVATTVLFASIYAAGIASSLGRNVNMGLTVGGLVGLMFILIGSGMSRIRPNKFVGIRTPWTLSSKRSWDKTHVLGGRLFIAMGIGILLTGLLQTKLVLATTIIVVLGGTIWLVVYSYVVCKNDPTPVSPLPTDSPKTTPTNSTLAE